MWRRPPGRSLANSAAGRHAIAAREARSGSRGSRPDRRSSPRTSPASRQGRIEHGPGFGRGRDQRIRCRSTRGWCCEPHRTRPPSGPRLAPLRRHARSSRGRRRLVLQLDEPGGANDFAALPLEILGQNRLGHFLGDADVEPVAAAANRKVDLSEHLPAEWSRAMRCLTPAASRGSRMPSDSKTSSERGCTTVARSQCSGAGMGIDDTALDTPATKLRSQEQPGRACTHDENSHLVHIEPDRRSGSNSAS